MLNDETLKDLNQAFRKSPKGFLVVDSGKPRFAVLDYDTYEELTQQKSQPEALRGGKILVTGGAGYIGSHAVRLLQHNGYEVVVYDNLVTGRREAVSGCEFVEADLADRSALDEVFAKHDFDAVMHFAASTEVEESVANPAKYFQNNVVCGLNLLQAMRESGVKKLIFSSTCAVYGNPLRLPVTEKASYAPESPYGLSKMIFEDILRWYAEAYGIDSVSLRYFNAAGAWAEEDLGYRIEGNSLLIPKVLDVASGRENEITVFGQDYETPDGTCIRDYIHVLDVAEAHMAALRQLPSATGAKFYNIGTGRGSSVLEVIDEAVETTGRMIPMTVAGRRPGDPAQLYADTDLAKKELGWKAKFTLSDIVRDAWEWHKKQKAS